MERVRRRIGDAKVNRLVVAFLKAGALSEGQLLRSDVGTPQGGILSPLLANIALSAIEERYTRHVWPRQTPTRLTDPAAIDRRANRFRVDDRRQGRVIRFPVRYADDFLILVAVPPGPAQLERATATAAEEKEALATALAETLHLELSDTKTLVTPVTQPIRFLGHHVRVRRHPTHGRLVSTAVIPRERTQRLRETIKALFQRRTALDSLEVRLRALNPLLRGWCHFYRHAWGAKRVFSRLDHYVWWTILRWLRKKHPHTSMGTLLARYGRRTPGRRSVRWHAGATACVITAAVPVRRFMLGSLRPPDYASASMESPVHNERCTPGSARGARKPLSVS
jgi:RNA-directed DNA polymerase